MNITAMDKVYLSRLLDGSLHEWCFTFPQLSTAILTLSDLQVGDEATLFNQDNEQVYYSEMDLKGETISEAYSEMKYQMKDMNLIYDPSEVIPMKTKRIKPFTAIMLGAPGSVVKLDV